MAKENHPISSPRRPGALPHFCSLRKFFVVAVVVQITLLVLTFAPGGYAEWTNIGVNTLFAQWLAAICLACLCLLNSVLNRLSTTTAFLFAWVVCLLVAAGFSSMGFLVDRALQFDYVPDNTGQAVFVWRTVLVTGLLAAALLRYLYVQHAWQQQLYARTQARVQALQSRIRPHFLFNSLNSIAGLIHEQPQEAEEATLDLADLFRGSLQKADKFIPMIDELDLAKKYLRMERIRMGERMQVAWDEQALPHDASVLPLILQPLVENAVCHGIEPNPEKGEISFVGKLHRNQVVIELVNTLTADQSAVNRPASNGIALNNIRERLFLAYGERAKLDARIHQSRYWVTMRFPYVRHTDSRR